MSKKSNATVIGGFVIGAVALLATGVALFGGSELFVERQKYVSYFDEPTKGLREGANVLMNGVRIGYVSDIALLVDTATLNTLTRVTMEILPDTFIQTVDGVPVAQGIGGEVDYYWLVHEAGLRAQLDIESFVTGQLLIEMEFRPNTVAPLRGIDPAYPEIPTVTSNLQRILANIQSWLSEVRSDVDVGELSQRVNSVLQGVDDLVNSQDLRDSLAGLDAFLNNEATQRLTTSLDAALVELRVTLTEATNLFRNAEGDIDTLVQDFKPALGRATAALLEAERVLAAARMQLDGNSPQVYQLESTLRELEGAAIAFREFFDYLERNPEALLRGKQQ